MLENTLLVIGAMLIHSAGHAPTARAAPVTTGAVTIHAGEPELFVDDFLIETADGLSRTLHQPRKDNGGNVPVITLDNGETLMAKGSILFDRRRRQYVMFGKAKPSTNIYRFTSRDGMTWVAGDDGQLETIQLDRRNPETQRVEGYGGMHCFHYDARDKEYPYKGWVFFGNWGNAAEGLYFIRSRDGKQWERDGLIANGYAGPGDPSSRRIEQDGRVIYGPGDTSRFGYDPRMDRFIGIIKFFTTEKVGPGNGLRSRAYLSLDSLDRPIDISSIQHVELVPPVAERDGDMPSDEYYASTAWRYGSIWLGGLLIWHRHDDYPHSAAGSAFLKLLVSRDGLHWRKVPFLNDAGVPEVFIPNGIEGGNHGQNDGGYMSEFSQGPLRIADELIYYYGSTSYGKNHSKSVRLTGGGIFRARLRVDGFVSVDAGTLTTRPLLLEGDDLHLNAAGPILVEVLTEDAKLLGSGKVTGDSISHRVLFNGQTLAKVTGKRPVRLRFSVHPGAHLYSFITRKSEKPKRGET
jgi:hypothetical protein